MVLYTVTEQGQQSKRLLVYKTQGHFGTQKQSLDPAQEQRRVRGLHTDTGQGQAEGANPRGMDGTGQPMSEPKACLSPVGELRADRTGVLIQSYGCSREL